MTRPGFNESGFYEARSRREFLRQLGIGTAGTLAAGVGLSVWGPVTGSRPASASARVGELRVDERAKDRTLVIVELGGGNDGLNTVVPISTETDDARYHDLRPTLGVTDPLPIGTAWGLHPSLPKLAQRYAAGEVAVIHGIGYEDPDLSHFGSFGIWWSAKGAAGTGAGGGAGAGWLGAYLDQTVGFDDPLAGIAIGNGPSPALRGTQSFATSIADTTGLEPRLPEWFDADADSLLGEWSDFAPSTADSSTLTGQVQRAIGLTVKARARLAKALSGHGPESGTTPAEPEYGDASVVGSLALAAELIQSPARPRVIYVNGIGDYDTHEGQATRHPALLQQLDDGIESFVASLGSGAEKVVLMTLSEFGRRPSENGSGTDHGTANVHFVIGPKVEGGHYGEAPSLSELDRSGNMIFTDDFRRLYATGLTWLGLDDDGAGAVLGNAHTSYSLFK